MLEILEKRLKREQSGWDFSIIYGPPGVGKTYIVSEIAKKLGYQVLNISLSSRESPVKSIISTLEMFFEGAFVEDKGSMSISGIKSMLLSSIPLAEDIILGLMANFLDMFVESYENVIVVLDDILDIYHEFAIKLLLHLKNLPTSRNKKIVAIFRKSPEYLIEDGHVWAMDYLDKDLFIEKFGEYPGFVLWELTEGKLGLANFIYNLVSKYEGKVTLDDMFFDVWKRLDSQEQKLLKKLTVWGIGYDGYFTLEVSDILSAKEKAMVEALTSKGILESLSSGGFRIASWDFAQFILSLISKDEMNTYLKALFDFVIREKKIFLSRRAYFSLYKKGCLRGSRYVFIKTLKMSRNGTLSNTDILVGIHQHFLYRKDIHTAERMFVFSYMWWIDMYNQALREIVEREYFYIAKYAYLSRLYEFIKLLFLDDRDDENILVFKNNNSPVIKFLDLLKQAWLEKIWNEKIDIYLDRLQDMIHPLWKFVYYYVKSSVSSKRRVDYIRRAYDIANELNNPVLIVEAVKLMVNISVLSRFDERIELLSKAYRISPPTSQLFEILVPDMIENFREVSKRQVIDEFIEFGHFDFDSFNKKIDILAKIAFHYMIIGNLPKAKSYINLLKVMSSSPELALYLECVYAVLVTSRSQFKNRFGELVKILSNDSDHILLLEDMARVWLEGLSPYLEYREINEETSITLWYLSFWTHSQYYINIGDIDEGIKFIGKVIDSLSAAGMEFSKHLAYVYKGRLLYKSGDILRGREYIKAAYMFFKRFGYEERANNLEGILSYIVPNFNNVSETFQNAKEIYLSWSSYYRGVDSIASLYESMIDMLLYVSGSQNVDIFLDRLVSEMLYILIAERIFVFAMRDDEIRYFKSYGLGVSSGSFSKTVRQVLQEGSKCSSNPSYLQVLYRGKDYTIGLFAESSVLGIFNHVHLDMASKVLRIVESVLVGNEIRELAIFDSLTGLYTRWYFSIRYNEEFKKSIQSGFPIVLLYLDIDDFKKINDRYGHLEGDEVLRKVGSVIKHNVRTVDVPARYGGEEMVVMLLGATVQEGVVVAERLRVTIIEAFRDKPYKVTVSIGVAGIPEMSAQSPDKLIHMADKAMYYAKRTGKNKVVVYSEEIVDIYPE